MEGIELVDWFYLGFCFFGVSLLNSIFKMLIEIKREIKEVRNQLGYGLGGNQSFLADIKESLEDIQFR